MASVMSIVSKVYFSCVSLSKVAKKYVDNVLTIVHIFSCFVV